MINILNKNKTKQGHRFEKVKIILYEINICGEQVATVYFILERNLIYKQWLNHKQVKKVTKKMFFPNCRWIAIASLALNLLCFRCFLLKDFVISLRSIIIIIIIITAVILFSVTFIYLSLLTCPYRELKLPRILLTKWNFISVRY